MVADGGCSGRVNLERGEMVDATVNGLGCNNVHMDVEDAAVNGLGCSSVHMVREDVVDGVCVKSRETGVVDVAAVINMYGSVLLFIVISTGGTLALMVRSNKQIVQ